MASLPSVIDGSPAPAVHDATMGVVNADVDGTAARTEAVASKALNGEDGKKSRSCLSAFVIEPIKSVGNWFYTKVILKVVEFAKFIFCFWKKSPEGTTKGKAEESVDDTRSEDADSAARRATLDKARDRVAKGKTGLLKTQTQRMSEEQVFVADLQDTLKTDSWDEADLKSKIRPIKEKLSEYITTVAGAKGVEGSDKKGFAKEILKDPLKHIDLLREATNRYAERVLKDSGAAAAGV